MVRAQTLLSAQSCAEPFRRMLQGHKLPGPEKKILYGPECFTIRTRNEAHEAKSEWPHRVCEAHKGRCIDEQGNLRVEVIGVSLFLSIPRSFELAFGGIE